MAIVKVTISNHNNGECKHEGKNNTEVEHVWIENIQFDGITISGNLINRPIIVTDYRQGDLIRVDLCNIDDWMYVQVGKVYGAHTVQVIRSRMTPRERDSHDDEWGFDFCDPNEVRLMPKQSDENICSIELVDHPMSINMEETFRCGLAADPYLAKEVDTNGNTMLFTESMGGNLLLFIITIWCRSKEV